MMYVKNSPPPHHEHKNNIDQNCTSAVKCTSERERERVEMAAVLLSLLLSFWMVCMFAILFYILSFSPPPPLVRHTKPILYHMNNAYDNFDATLLENVKINREPRHR